MLEEQKVTDKEVLTLEERRAFMKLPMEERRRILAEQAEEAAKYFEEDYADWKELQSGDIIKY